MRRILALVCLTCFCALTSTAQLEAWFDYKVFHSPENGAYVESHLNFTGSSLAYASVTDSTYFASVRATIILKSGEEIVGYKKIDIAGPEVPAYEFADFMDLQRFSVPANGDYIFELELEDLNDSTSPVHHMEQEFTVDHPRIKPFISDITFLKAYAPASETTELTKSGYDMIPYVNNYFPSSFDVMIFYGEVYNTNDLFGDGEKFALSTVIRDEKGEVASGIQRIKRKDATPVIPVLQTLDISALRTGSYALNIEVRDRKNTLVLAKSIQFFRNKYAPDPTNDELAAIDVSKTFAAQYEDRSELLEHIQSLQPISSNLELATVQNRIEGADLIMMQQYLYHFWAKRASESEDPEATADGLWYAYAAEVQKAEAAFGTRIKKGYETDRGRVYLRYGPPNTRVTRHHNQNVFPYEIWHYYDIGTQHDRRFLFYDETAVLEDFSLLHSDVQGEIQNHDWKFIMRNRTASGNFGTSQQNLDQHTQNSFDYEELEMLFYNPR